MISPQGRFYEMNRLYSWKVFITTIIFSLLVYFSNTISVLMLPFDGSLGFELPPYKLSLMLLLVALGCAITGNLASSLIISLTGGISIVNAVDPSLAPADTMSLLLLSLSIGLLAGWLGNYLNTPKVLGYLVIAINLIFVGIALYADVAFGSVTEKYYQEGISPGRVTDFGILNGLPLTTIIIGLAVLLILVFMSLKYFKDDFNLATEETSTYKLIGFILQTIGALFGIISIALFTVSFNQQVFSRMGEGKNSGAVFRDVFIHQSDPLFAVTKDPINIFYISVFAITIILVGVLFRILSVSEGNIEEVQMGSLSSYVSWVFGFIVFFIYGLYPIASILGNTNTFYMSEVSFPVYFTLITMVFCVYSLITVIVEVISGFFLSEE